MIGEKLPFALVKFEQISFVVIQSTQDHQIPISDYSLATTDEDQKNRELT